MICYPQPSSPGLDLFTEFAGGVTGFPSEINSARYKWEQRAIDCPFLFPARDSRQSQPEN